MDGTYLYVNRNAQKYYEAIGCIESNQSLKGLRDTDIYKGKNLKTLQQIRERDLYVLKTGINTEVQQVVHSINSNFHLQFHTKRWRLEDDENTYLLLSISKEYATFYIGKLAINLSKRQVEVLSGAFMGLSSKEIAKKINLSYRTVELYLTQVKQKIQIENKSQIHQFIVNNHLVNAMEFIFKRLNN